MVISVVLTGLLWAACSPIESDFEITESDKAIQRQARIDSLVALLSTAGMPPYLPDPDSEVVKDGAWFDVSGCFSVLGGLSPEPGYVLDYVYWYNGAGGEPVLYCRPADTPAFRSFREFQQAMGDITFIQMRKMYLDQLIVDGTEEGYFDFAIHTLIGTQFYLYWHAIYNDTRIICTEAAMERALGDIESHSEGIKPAARRLMLEPVVTVEDEHVVVSLVTFTKWGGFYRRTLTIKREFPHQILQEDRTLLLEYDCGWVT
jgi:hypothetical protein